MSTTLAGVHHGDPPMGLTNLENSGNHFNFKAAGPMLGDRNNFTLATTNGGSAAAVN